MPINFVLITDLEIMQTLFFYWSALDDSSMVTTHPSNTIITGVIHASDYNLSTQKRRGDKTGRDRQRER